MWPSTQFEESVKSSNRASSWGQRVINVVGYIRVSKDDTVVGPSREFQAQKITEYASSKGYPLKAMYIDEYGSDTEDQPELVRLLNQLKKRRYDADPEMVVTYSLDRLARSVRSGCEILHNIHEKNLSLMCLDLGVDLNTAAGKLAFNMKLSFIQSESLCSLD